MPNLEPEVAARLTVSQPNLDEAIKIAIAIGRMTDGMNSGTVMVALGLFKAYVETHARDEHCEGLKRCFDLAYNKGK